MEEWRKGRRRRVRHGGVIGRGGKVHLRKGEEKSGGESFRRKKECVMEMAEEGDSGKMKSLKIGQYIDTSLFGRESLKKGGGMGYEEGRERYRVLYERRVWHRA